MPGKDKNFDGSLVLKTIHSFWGNYLPASHRKQPIETVLLFLLQLFLDLYQRDIEEVKCDTKKLSFSDP